LLSDGVVAARLLAARGSIPALEMLEVRSTRGSRATPILCIHGAFGGAWMWEVFLHVLAQHGRTAAAVSLRGHGKSGGRERLHEAVLADYTADILRAFEEFAEPPVVVAHSLGGLLMQRLLGHVPLRALVLLAPLPPEGMLLITPKLLATNPAIWREMLDGVHASGPALRRVADLMFSGHFAPNDHQRHLVRMVPEGLQVLIEAHLPAFTLPAFAVGVPAVVISGDEDPIVTSDAALRTAIYHGAEYVSVRGAGHLLHLEPGAEQAEHAINSWLDTHGL
jgi:pimeloyl-ACP methyl ester carboxylesterase